MYTYLSIHICMYIYIYNVTCNIFKLFLLMSAHIGCIVSSSVSLSLQGSEDWGLVPQRLTTSVTHHWNFISVAIGGRISVCSC